MFDRLTDMEVGRDVLTQLYNRRFLPTIMRRELSLARRQENQFAVLMIDVDHFKRVNDTHGHEAGDRVLQHIAALLMAHGRASDFFFRYGGEEFLAVVNEVDQASAVQIAEKVRARVEQAELHVNEHTPLKVTVSIGLAMHAGHPDYRHLINQADEALYHAKRGGRNQVCLAADGQA
jgi:diguanylate cyclase